MNQSTARQRQWVDPDLVDEARIKIEAGTRVLAAALLDSAEWDLVAAAEHAVRMNEQAARLLAVAS